MKNATVWVLEPDVFPSNHDAFVRAVHEAGHEVVLWQDDWGLTGSWPRLDSRTVVFHGSLENAARIAAELPWRPGAYCDVAAFQCSTWYPQAQRWLLHRHWQIVSASQLVANPSAVLAASADIYSLFVRPDSPLKPFAGRVLRRNEITLEALDYGFYFDDAAIPVVVAPVRSVEREWRYVVVDRQIVAGSAYDPAKRAAVRDDPGGAPWQFAATVAATLAPPKTVYVMDICEADNELRLLELNPFSGADLYACDLAIVVREVSSAAAKAFAFHSENF